MPNAKEVKETALAVITFFVRPSVFLLFGLIGGYALGFTDAFRDTDTIGSKAARAVYQIHPASVSEGIYERASAIKALKDKKMGVIDVDSLAAPPTTPPPTEVPPT